MACLCLVQALQIGMKEVGDLELAALSAAEAEFAGKMFEVPGVRGWVLAKEVILNMQEVKGILQRQTSTPGVFPIQQRWRSIRPLLNVPGSEVPMDPEGGQRIRIAQFGESCRYSCASAIRVHRPQKLFLQVRGLFGD